MSHNTEPERAVAGHECWFAVFVTRLGMKACMYTPYTENARYTHYEVACTRGHARPATSWFATLQGSRCTALVINQCYICAWPDQDPSTWYTHASHHEATKGGTLISLSPVAKTNNHDKHYHIHA